VIVNNFKKFISCPIAVFHSIGQWVMDFGFSSFLEKFEHYYGERLAKILVGLVGCAVISTSLGLTWSYLFNPLWDLFGLAPEISDTWGKFEKLLTYIGFVLTLIWIISLVLSLKYMKNEDLDYTKDVERIYDKLLKIADEGATPENLKELERVKDITKAKRRKVRFLFQFRQ
jgi:hypothetical protein